MALCEGVSSPTYAGVSRRKPGALKFDLCLRMIDWSTCPAVDRTPGKVSGAWLFRGTRVPVHA